VFRTRLLIAALLGLAAAATLSAQERKFDLAFSKDKDGKYVPYYQEMTTDLVQVIKVQGQDLTQKQNSKFWYKWTPTKEEAVPAVDKEPAYTKWTVEQQVEGLEMTIDISGNPITYSSKTEQPAGSASNPGLVDFFKNMKDVKLAAVIGKNYKVLDVQGKEEFVRKLSTGSQQMEQLLKGAMTDDSLKQMVDPTYNIFPDNGVAKKVNETWEKKSTLNLGPIGTYELTYKLKYLGVEKDKDKIEIETVINFTPPANPGPLLFQIKAGSTMTSIPAGSKGEILYDPKTQRIESAVIRIKLQGNLTVAIGNTDTKVELTLEQTTTIKTQATSYLTPAAPTPPMPGTPPVPPPTPPVPPKP